MHLWNGDGTGPMTAGRMPHGESYRLGPGCTAPDSHADIHDRAPLTPAEVPGHVAVDVPAAHIHGRESPSELPPARRLPSWRVS